MKYQEEENLPKKGTERPTSSVETTRAVLMSLEYMKKLGLFVGLSVPFFGKLIFFFPRFFLSVLVLREGLKHFVNCLKN